MVDVDGFSFSDKSPGGKTGRLTPYPVGVKLCYYLSEFFVTIRIIGRFCFIIQFPEQ